MDQYMARGIRLAMGVGVGLGLLSAAIIVAVLPDSGTDRSVVTVMVRLDTRFDEVAQLLKEAGAVESAEQLVERAQTRGLVDQVKVGPHAVIVGESLDKIIDKLVKAPK